MPEIRVPGGGARIPRPETEAHFQERVQRLLADHGWAWMHVPRSMVKGGWRTQITGPLGKGWPDLFAVRGSRAVWLELKKQTGVLDADQRRVHALLVQVAPVHVFRPSQWDELVSLLQ